MRDDYPFETLAAITALNTGRSVVLIDGDRAALVSPASSVDAELIRFHESTCNAPVAVALGASHFDDLGLEVLGSTGLPIGQPVDLDQDPFEAMSRRGRARTIRALADGSSGPRLRRPGHVTTLRASPGNLLTRLGLVEATIDLMLLAGHAPAALTSFVFDGEGTPLAPDRPEFPEALRTMPHVPISDVRSARLLEVDGQPGSDVEALFVDAMVRMPSGIAVVTCRSDDGAPQGLVVSSLTSYSSKPPSIVISIANTSRSHDTLLSVDHFGVNVLAADQADHARAFASRAADKFASIDWQWSGEVPRLENVQTFLRCRRIAQFTFGDHSLIVGAIIAGESRPVSPLVYVNRSFGGGAE